ncbi:MAG: hypothetical protein DCC68_07230 [Planctomycetota bacterium]|nr:MAG: hypothetical protein DCC68_07230 [Planctomycetota bacterium]
MEPMRASLNGWNAVSVARSAIWAVVACVVVGCGTNDPSDKSPPAAIAARPTAPVSKTSPTVALAQGRMTVNGKPVKLPGIIEAWEAALGPASRREVLAATETEPFVNVHIWDAAGIVAVERPDLAQVTKVSFVFVPETALAVNAANRELTPQSAFSGALSIDGIAFDASTTPAWLNGSIAEKFGGAKFEPLKRFPHSWNIAYAVWTVTALTDVKGEQLVEVAIGE